MDTRELAQDFAAMMAAGQMEEAAMKHWSPALATYEAMAGGMPDGMDETHGIGEAAAKAQWWMENNEVHGMKTEGPFVHGDRFLLLMEIDVTPKGGERMQMREVVEYTVADGKVVEERYFY
jgi:SnoaL-like domain